MDINVGSGDDDFDEVSDDHSVCNDPSSSSTSAPDNVGIRPRRESGQGSMDASRSSNASLVAEVRYSQYVQYSLIVNALCHRCSWNDAKQSFTLCNECFIA
jgi:hypothetical protein